MRLPGFAITASNLLEQSIFKMRRLLDLISGQWVVEGVVSVSAERLGLVGC
jgi:hypothetical protein